MIHVDDKIKRAVVFYFAISLFFLLTPIVLAYSLGYSVDFRNFNIYKTGILYVKSQPAGAWLYVNGKMMPETTPTRIENLKPGTYKVEVRREGFYPWQKDLVIRPTMVTRADEIILFPIRQEMNKISNLDVVDFVIPDNRNYLYYMSSIGLIRSNVDGTNMKKLSTYSNWPKRIKGKKFSPDGNKFLFFDGGHIWVVYLNPDPSAAKMSESARIDEVVFSMNDIVDVFWYSESNHIVFVTDKDINVVELYGKGTRNSVVLYKFNAGPQGLYYDKGSDSLYFTDLSGTGWNKKSRLFRLYLRQKFVTQFIERFRREFDSAYETR